MCHALAYVLNNGRRHGMQFLWRKKANASGHGVETVGLDPCASGCWFDGWREKPSFRGLEHLDPPVAAPHTWLLHTGWRKHRLISLAEVPGS